MSKTASKPIGPNLTRLQRARAGAPRAKYLRWTLRQFRASARLIDANGSSAVSVTEVARGTGLASSTISRAECGLRALRPETAALIAGFFGVPAWVIEHLDGNTQLAKERAGKAGKRPR